MLRRLEVFFPIVLLTIVVQLFAPIAAFRAVAYAATDPLYMGSICSEMVSSADEGQTAPPRISMTTEVAAGFARSAMAAPLASSRLR